MRLRDRYTLIALMTQRSLSCRQLAQYVGCSHQMVGHLRTGLISTCTPILAAKIEKALNVEPGRLFEPKSLAGVPAASSVRRTAVRREVPA